MCPRVVVTVFVQHALQRCKLIVAADAAIQVEYVAKFVARFDVGCGCYDIAFVDGEPQFGAGAQRHVFPRFLVARIECDEELRFPCGIDECGVVQNAFVCRCNRIDEVDALCRRVVHVCGKVEVGIDVMPFDVVSAKQMQPDVVLALRGLAHCHIVFGVGNDVIKSYDTWPLYVQPLRSVLLPKPMMACAAVVVRVCGERPTPAMSRFRSAR